MAERPIDGQAKALLTIAGALVILAAAIGDAATALIICAFVYLIVAFVMTLIPLRHSLMGLMFLALTLENPADLPATGEWKGPTFLIGGILLNHMNTVDRSLSAVSWVPISFMDMFLVTLGVIAAFRKANGNRIDSAGRLATPRPLVRLAHLSFLGMGFVWLSGMLRGGDFGMSLWQIDRVVYLPAIFLLFQTALRGPQDFRALARLVLIAAVYKSFLALYVNQTVHLYPYGPSIPVRLECATTHHDSMLFAMAFALLVLMGLERVGRSPWRLPLLLLPVLAAGIFANNRRMAWVQIGFVLFSIFLVTPDSPFKRRLWRAAKILSPFMLIYTAVGWNSGADIFKPIRSLRSVIDTQSNASSFWREIENFNLIETLKGSPVLGTGYGVPFNEVVMMPAVNYSLERFAPHNAILGLWAYGGVFGYTMLTLLWSGGVFFAIRAFRAAKSGEHRVAALASFSTVPIYFVQCWGDLGLGTWIGVWLTACGLAVSAKLAVATGAWGASTAPTTAVERVNGAEPATDGRTVNRGAHA